MEEPEEHSIARYLGGLNFEIASVVNLQTYCSLNDVKKLALNLERQSKARSTMGRFGSRRDIQGVLILRLPILQRALLNRKLRMRGNNHKLFLLMHNKGGVLRAKDLGILLQSVPIGV